MRALRSNRLRAALWIGASGRCSICCADVDDWHADHIKPWALGGATDLSNLQVLCVRCNLSKGIQCFRPHQQESVDRCKRIAAGEDLGPITVADVAPSGGKTIMFMASMSEMIDGVFAQRGLVLVPNGNLRDQVEKEWAKHLGSLFNRSGIEAISKRDGKAPMLRRGDPYRIVIATYQLALANPTLFLDFVESATTIVAFDEIGLCADGQAWGALVERIAASARHSIIASGTMFRHDGGRIPLVKYVRNEAGQEVCETHITYKVRDSISDKATIPIEFHKVNALVEYHFKGTERAVNLHEELKGEEGKKLDAFLAEPEVVREVIDKTLADHAAYKARTGHDSRVIVVCPWQRGSAACAEEVAQYIRDRHALVPVLAISDNDTADEELKKFRDPAIRKGDVIVTVAKASIGLDVPDLTHMAYLSKYRSLPYSIQAWLRLGRFDRACGLPWEQQGAFVFLPADPRNVQNLEWLRSEQDVGLRAIEDREAREAAEREDHQDDFVPLGARIGDTTTAAPMSSVSTSALDEAGELARKHGLLGVPHAKLAELIEAARSGPTASRRVDNDEQPETPSERRERLGRIVQGLANKLDSERVWNHGQSNKRLVEKFKIRRAEWSEDHYERAISWLRSQLSGIEDRV